MSQANSSALPLFSPPERQKELIREAKVLRINLTVESNAHEILEEIENEIGGRVERVEMAIKELTAAVEDMGNLDKHFDIEMTLRPSVDWKKNPSWVRRAWLAFYGGIRKFIAWLIPG